MKLYGTTTSPFVRRVRVVAIEVGEPIDRIDTAPDAGQAELREVSPIRKVPVAQIDDRVIYDSRTIIEYLTFKHGWGELQPARDRWRESNLINAIDDALLSIVQVFYLKRDGVAIDGTPYATRQIERADAIFAWLGKQLDEDRRSFQPTGLPRANRPGGFGLAELSLVCALDWMDFRKTYPTEKLTALAGVREVWSQRPSIVATKPVA